jgi:hypothetical protein
VFISGKILSKSQIIDDSSSDEEDSAVHEESDSDIGTLPKNFNGSIRLTCRWRQKYIFVITFLIYFLDDPVELGDDNDEDDDDVDDDEDENPVKNVKKTTVKEKFPLSLKLELVKKVREVNRRKALSHTPAIKSIDWTKIDIDGYSADELKECLASIMKVIPRIRTLDEMITDYETNYKKIEFRTNSTAPKLPRNAVMRYIDDNREKLKKMFKKQNPTETTIGLVSNCSRCGRVRF